MSFPKFPVPTDGMGSAVGAASHLKHSVNNECLAGMDMIYELFQQQAKRLELQLYQQLRDQSEIESTHNQLSSVAQQLQRLQLQNAELRRLVDANEMSIRAMYEHARSVQQAQNGLLTVCENLAKDREILRQALREECPDWTEPEHEIPKPDLPARSAELPPLEDLLPPPEASGEAGEGGHSNHQHMETALALLSTVATHKADASTAAAETGSSADADQQASNHGSNGSDTGSNHGSSNPGTEDTAVLSRDGNGNERSSQSKGSPEEGDSNDGVGSGHGSDSNGDSPVDPTADSGSGDGSSDSKQSGDSNDGHSNGDSNSDGGRDGSGGSADSLPVGDGSSSTSASRSGSNSSSPPHEIDVEPPSEPPKKALPSGSKRKR